MKNILLGSLGVLALFLPGAVSAHERQMFSVGGKEYLFVVGSLNEPVSVGDKTGVDLRVLIPDPADRYNASSPKAVPVTGLEKDLKVEIQAGGEKKLLDLKAAYGKPGSYTAPFYPTAETTYSYRVFGMLNSVDVSLSFNCDSGGETAESDYKKHNLSAGVDRTYKTGGFGCPASRDDISFPSGSSKKSTAGTPVLIYVALFSGLLGSVLGIKNSRS